MATECTPKTPGFHPHFERKMEADFNGGCLTSNGGGLLLREVERRTGILRRLSESFTDRRDRGRIEHRDQELVTRRVIGWTLGTRT